MTAAEDPAQHIIASDGQRTAGVEPLNHAFLLPFTLLLSVTEAALIIMAWLLLRV